MAVLDISSHLLVLQLVPLPRLLRQGARGSALRPAQHHLLPSQTRAHRHDHSVLCAAGVYKGLSEMLTTTASIFTDFLTLQKYQDITKYT